MSAEKNVYTFPRQMKVITRRKDHGSRIMDLGLDSRDPAQQGPGEGGGGEPHRRAMAVIDLLIGPILVTHVHWCDFSLLLEELSSLSTRR